jgi:Family of unknown function (DUF5985)
MAQLLQGAIAMACMIAGLFFLRFWRVTHDRLFVFFALAFWVLGVHWAVLGVSDFQSEHRYVLYVPRLLAFILIIVGIVVKNRQAGPSRRSPGSPRGRGAAHSDDA